MQLLKKIKLYFSGSNKRETNVAISPNGQYLVIATDNIKKNANAYKVHVYNTNTFELKYTKDYQKHTDKYYEPNDLAIDDQATVYVLGKLFKKREKTKKKMVKLIINSHFLKLIRHQIKI